MQTINITVPKVGALFGEAVIITAEKAKRDFRYSIKRQGGMRGKGRLLGIQFETLFHHGLKSESLRSKFKHSSLKTINKTYICKNKTNIYINKTIICTNITFIYTFLRSAAKYLPRFSKVSTAVVMIFHRGNDDVNGNDNDEGTKKGHPERVTQLRLRFRASKLSDQLVQPL